jgi:hypothetical protein
MSLCRLSFGHIQNTNTNLNTITHIYTISLYISSWHRAKRDLTTAAYKFALLKSLLVFEKLLILSNKNKAGGQICFCFMYCILQPINNYNIYAIPKFFLNYLLLTTIFLINYEFELQQKHISMA